MCVLAFSTVDRDSFLAIEHWKEKVEPHSDTIGTKTSLAYSRDGHTHTLTHTGGGRGRGDCDVYCTK